MQKITPCLWFDKNCEEAITFYTSIFSNGKITSIKRYPSDMQVGPMADMAGKVLTAMFELDGFTFQALDGGPMFKPNPSISFMVNFDPSRNQNAEQDIENLWNKLSEGGKALMPFQEYPFSKKYGWIEDRFGISWQLILTNPTGDPRPNIIPSLMFTQNVCGKAEEALTFYTNLFKDSLVGKINRYPAGMGEKEGNIMFADFALSKEWFGIMESSANHEFVFTEGISLSVTCEDQIEIDRFWNAITTNGGTESQCGWCKDAYGVSWQIIPKRLGELLESPDKTKANKALQAMLTMQKLDIAKLEEAYNS